MIDSPPIDSDNGHTTLALRRRDGDDIHLSLEGGRGDRWAKSSLEFCTVGHGGGQSPYTRLALRHLFDLDTQPDTRLLEAFQKLGAAPLPQSITRYDDMAIKSHLTLRNVGAGYGLVVFTDRSAMGMRPDRLTGTFGQYSAALSGKLGVLQKAMHIDNLNQPQRHRALR